MLKIKDLRVSIENVKILKGVDLEIKKGTVSALMGKNGSGKSTLAQTIMGSPFYIVDSGQVIFNSKNLLDKSTDERSKMGLFLSFQYPSEIIGVTVSSYLRMLYNIHNKETVSPVKFRSIVKPSLELLEMDESFLQRSLNEGFSGGEKKRMEMLQMLVIKPKLLILDELDSGLDIDAIKIVSVAVNSLLKDKETSVLIITHYARILNYIKPDFVHVMNDGEITESGGIEIAERLEKEGYIKND